MDVPSERSAERAHLDASLAYWDRAAADNDRGEGPGRFYRRRLRQVYRTLVPPDQRVLELGCGRGDLLADLRPAVGVGVDLSAGDGSPGPATATPTCTSTAAPPARGSTA